MAAGLTPAEALRTATINGAKFMKMENFYGSVEAGKSSDLLILNANPLEDITNTQSIKTLILGTQVFSAQDLKGMLEQLRK